jgi:hypothetical protein
MSKEALEIATINARLFNRQITYAESLSLIFAIRSKYEKLITNKNTNVIK